MELPGPNPPLAVRNHEDLREPGTSYPNPQYKPHTHRTGNEIRLTCVERDEGVRGNMKWQR